MKQLRWAHTATGRAQLGDATVARWDQQVKKSGLERVAHARARGSISRSKRTFGRARRAVSARRAARGGY